MKMHAKHLTRSLTWLLSPLINKVDRPPTTRPINVVFVDNASSRRLDAQNTTIICICIWWLPEKQRLPNPAPCNAELTQLHEFAMSRFPHGRAYIETHVCENAVRSQGQKNGLVLSAHASVCCCLRCEECESTHTRRMHTTREHMLNDVNKIHQRSRSGSGRRWNRDDGICSAVFS